MFSDLVYVGVSFGSRFLRVSCCDRLLRFVRSDVVLDDLFSSAILWFNYGHLVSEIEIWILLGPCAPSGSSQYHVLGFEV